MNDEQFKERLNQIKGLAFQGAQENLVFQTHAELRDEVRAFVKSLDLENSQFDLVCVLILYCRLGPRWEHIADVLQLSPQKVNGWASDFTCQDFVRRKAPLRSFYIA